MLRDDCTCKLGSSGSLVVLDGEVLMIVFLEEEDYEMTVNDDVEKIFHEEFVCFYT